MNTSNEEDPAETVVANGDVEDNTQTISTDEPNDAQEQEQTTTTTTVEEKKDRAQNNLESRETEPPGASVVQPDTTDAAVVDANPSAVVEPAAVGASVVEPSVEPAVAYFPVAVPVADLPQPKTFHIQVPPNTVSGQVLQVQAPSGLLLQCQVPSGYGPGSVLQLQDPGSVANSPTPTHSTFSPSSPAAALLNPPSGEVRRESKDAWVVDVEVGEENTPTAAPTQVEMNRSSSSHTSLSPSPSPSMSVTEGNVVVAVDEKKTCSIQQVGRDCCLIVTFCICCASVNATELDSDLPSSEEMVDCEERWHCEEHCCCKLSDFSPQTLCFCLVVCECLGGDEE